MLLTYSESGIVYLVSSFTFDGCVSLGTYKNVTYKREMRIVIHTLDVDVVNLFHNVKDLNLTNRFVYRRISPIAIAKI